ncbi:MAG TPA: hypothetical protein VF384_07150 [Planctomycetota bacterium]
MKSLLAAGLALLLGACGAVSYTPKPDRPFEPLPSEFKSSHRVTLENAQPAAEEVEGGHWLVNRHAWTDVAIAITQRELTARGMTVATGAPKALKLCLESAKTESGFVKISSEVVMRVETGDGYKATFTGLNSSAMMANVERQIDGAMMRVVVAMLSDPKIVKYLSE